jgi:hypothetical protein
MEHENTSAKQRIRVAYLEVMRVIGNVSRGNVT